jgi:hypothetical protein
MALRKLEINDGRLMLDDAFAGLVTTVPSDVMSADAAASSEDGAVTLKVRWTIEKNPDPFLPLEILALRLDEFFSKGALVGGRRYELHGSGPLRGRKLGFPYNTYFKFRIKARAPYDAGVFSKMPIACWQERDRAFAVIYPKELTLPHGPLPLFIKTSGVGAGVEFAAALMAEFDVERKQLGWFGAGVDRRKRECALSKGQSFEAAFTLVAADTWVECVRHCEKKLYKAEDSFEEPSPESLASGLNAAVRYYDRVWDSKNRTHMHLPVKGQPRFESVEFKHSHVTDDITKLVLYERLIRMGCGELLARKRELLAKLTEGAYCFRRDGARLWHTTTYFNGEGLDAFTHHGVGFVGFPGGMATVARRLFEYCSLGDGTALAEMAGSAADWLLEKQNKDGSWPASVDKARSGKGCVASTAEAARALVAGHMRTERSEYRAAAKAGMRYISRDESFFECRQYLRDVDCDNFDGMTAEACVHAALDWHGLAGDGRALEQAEKWGYYALQWVRPRSTECGAEPSFDGLSRSITPRVDVWGGLLIARAFMRLSNATGRESWRAHAWRLFGNIAGLQERDGGFSETWFLDFPSGLQSIIIEPTFVTDAFIEFVLDACAGRGSHLGNILRAERESAGARHPPLRPTGEPDGETSVSKDRPEWIIDERLRLGIAFDGAYGWRDRSAQSAYAILRETATGRGALKGVPAMKILLNRHRAAAPIIGIGESSSISPLEISEEDAGENGRRVRYRTPLHDMTLSVAATGVDAQNLPAADLALCIKTLAGDLRLRQVRVDLTGRYNVISVQGRDGFRVASGGVEYSLEIIEGSVDAIIRDGGRLALDITMRSNWNYFGEYSLRVRMTRRRRAGAQAG